MIFAVDWDVMVVKQPWIKIGSSIQGTDFVLRTLMKIGHKIIIFTEHNGDNFLEIKDWFQCYNLKPNKIIETRNFNFHANIFFSNKSFPPFTNWTHVFNVYVKGGPVDIRIHENDKFCPSYFRNIDKPIEKCGKKHGSKKCRSCEDKCWTLENYYEEITT